MAPAGDAGPPITTWKRLASGTLPNTLDILPARS